MVNKEKRAYSTAEAAKILGISRVAVFKRIKSGALLAQKVGRNYVIAAQDLLPDLGRELTSAEKRTIEQTVTEAISEYREAFELLGKE